VEKDNLKHRLPEELHSTEFHVNGKQCLMQRWKKCVENEKDCGKKNLNSVKDVPKVYIIFIITIITVKKKKKEEILLLY
jgi:hypothetical protein